MGLKFLDTAEVLDLTEALQLAALGYKGVGGYLRADRLPKSMVAALHKAELKIFSIWEKGEPVSDSYNWTYAHGQSDGMKAAAYAFSVGQPSGTTISPTCDFDSDPEVVEPYLKGFHDEIKTYGYYSLPYGNGATLEDIIRLGYAVGGYLAQSTGFEGYKKFFGSASIVQGQSVTVTGLDTDRDTVVTPTIQLPDRTISLIW